MQWLPLVLIIPVIIFWVWMFRDMLKNDSLSDTARSTWTVAFIFLNAFAAVFYYVYEYRRRRQ
jgi:heme/copper-type cytochrome/quinol oxidase subunit 2